MGLQLGTRLRSVATVPRRLGLDQLQVSRVWSPRIRSTGISSVSGPGGLAGVEGAGILVGGGALALTEPTSGPWE
jgi:hypothetical protein